MRGTASIDIAIEHGATLIVCINPLVPFENETINYSELHWHKEASLSEKGVPTITNQAMRIILHSGLHYHIKQLRRSHPEVDIILIEPRPKDYEMFLYNIMHYSARLKVAQHGFESVTYDLAKDYHFYKDTLARHHIPISRRLVIGELAEIAQSNDDPQVIRRVIEARANGCGPRTSRGIAVRARTDRGLAESVGLESDVELETSAGRIRVRSTRGRVTALSDRGEISAMLLAGATKTPQRFSTVTGSIEVWVTDSCAFDVALATSGRLITDFSMQVEHRDREEPDKLGTVRVGAGGQPLEVRSRRGDLSIRRLVEPDQLAVGRTEGEADP